MMNFAMSLMVATIMMEAGNQPFACQRLVAVTIHNRAISAIKENGLNYNRAVIETILKKKQFSCWNDKRPWDVGNVYNMAETMLTHKISNYVESLYYLAITGTVEMLDGGIQWYHQYDVHPKWSLSNELVPYCTCGDHVFYKESGNAD